MLQKQECPPNPGADTTWIEQAQALLLTPKSDRAMPVAVVRTEGKVVQADALLVENGTSARLTYDEGGPQPVAILDFGKQSVGGYAVFNVTAKRGMPVVRLAYACHPDGLSEIGCFTRETSARYLGEDVDLPILPGNVNRHETYTIPRTGRFIAPLLQGQTRYVRVQLDTPGTSVEIDSLVMVNSEVYDRSPYDGLFLCSDERLNRLWAISTWTLQIASFPNHNAWKTVDGWLLPRKLEQADDVGLSVAGAGWRDIVLETTFELRANPHHVSAAGVAFRAQNAANAYLAEVALDGTFRFVLRKDGQDTVLSTKRLSVPLTDGAPYKLAVEARGPVLITRLDDVVIDETRDETFSSGRVGFYTPKEKWPLFDAIRVTDAAGKVLLFDDFTGDLSQWQFARTLSYVADGAKRDRLVWSGDLYFAQRSAYCAFANPTYLRDSLKMLAFNQTPEGYVHASPYPERSTPPDSGDYGPFPSDEFAAWLVPVAWDHLLHTDDVATMREIWPAIERLLAYLQVHLDANGLFVQRPETSKHAGDLKMGDVRTRSYMNILLWGTFRDAGQIADRLGLEAKRDAAWGQADEIKRALLAAFWDEPKGYFKDALETPTFGPEANALAMAMKLVTREQAQRIASHFKRIGHGKFQSLASRGRFEYGFAQSGLQMIFDHNWPRLLDAHWEGAATTTECMGMMTKGWGDESHPDTTIAGHFSAFVLGVQPTEPGFRRFRVRPQPTREVRWARGIVPTPNGPIDAAWDTTGKTFKLTLTVPENTCADVVLPAGGTVSVNGEPAALAGLRSGSYEIEVCDLPADAWVDPTDTSSGSKMALTPVVTASTSDETDGWGLTTLFAPDDDTAHKGYRSAAHASYQETEWIEFDLGEETTLARLVLLPSGDPKISGGAGAGFPRDFTIRVAKERDAFETVVTFTDYPVSPRGDALTVDLYTVIGFPTARYVRIEATRLGEPSIGEPDAFRLQIYRVRLLRA